MTAAATTRLRSLAALACCALLSACAALALSGCTLVSTIDEANSEKGQATVQIVQPVKKKLTAYKSVGLKVKSESADASAEVAQFVSLLVADLGAHHLQGLDPEARPVLERSPVLVGSFVASG